MLFYTLFNKLRWEELSQLLDEQVELMDMRRGNLVGRRDVISRLQEIRKNHGSEVWNIVSNQAKTQQPEHCVSETRLQYINPKTCVMVSVVTRLSFSSLLLINKIASEKVYEEPV